LTPSVRLRNLRRSIYDLGREAPVCVRRRI